MIGDCRQTAAAFLQTSSLVIGFISVDVDYFSSASACLSVMGGAPAQYLPAVPVYFDDIFLPHHNPWCGELLALREFNHAHALRKLAPSTALRERRFLKTASWIPQMYTLHVLDHPVRSPGAINLPQRKM